MTIKLVDVKSFKNGERRPSRVLSRRFYEVGILALVIPRSPRRRSNVTEILSRAQALRNCSFVCTYTHVHVEDGRGRLTRGNHRRSILLSLPLSLFPSPSFSLPLSLLSRTLSLSRSSVQLLSRALTADLHGETIGNPVKPGSTRVNDKTSAARHRVVLLSDFHKADQRPSVVKKQAYATVILRS